MNALFLDDGSFSVIWVRLQTLQDYLGDSSDVCAKSSLISGPPRQKGFSSSISKPGSSKFGKTLVAVLRMIAQNLIVGVSLTLFLLFRAHRIYLYIMIICIFERDCICTDAEPFLNTTKSFTPHEMKMRLALTKGEITFSSSVV